MWRVLRTIGVDEVLSLVSVVDVIDHLHEGDSLLAGLERFERHLKRLNLVMMLADHNRDKNRLWRLCPPDNPYWQFQLSLAELKPIVDFKTNEPTLGPAMKFRNGNQNEIICSSNLGILNWGENLDMVLWRDLTSLPTDDAWSSQFKWLRLG